MFIFLLEKKQKTKQKIYDYSNFCDQAENDPGMDQSWQARPRDLS
jgi:hypothetical protein